MEKKDVSSKVSKERKPKKKRGLFNCCLSIPTKSETEEDDDQYESTHSVKSIQNSRKTGIPEKHEVIVTYRRNFYCPMHSNLSNSSLPREDPNFELEYYESDQEKRDVPFLMKANKKEKKKRETAYILSTDKKQKEKKEKPFELKADKKDKQEEETLFEVHAGTDKKEKDRKEITFEDHPDKKVKEIQETPDDRSEKEKLVKTILNKYFEIRKSEALEKESEEISRISQQKKTKDIEEGSSDKMISTQFNDNLNDPATLPEDEGIPLHNALSSLNLSKCKMPFPTKSKSAPTNFASYDSLADICLKLYDLKKNDNHPNSFNSVSSKKSNKKKLELIFTKSVEDLNSSQNNNSVIALDYKISCEGTSLCTGTLKTANVLYQSEVEDFETDSMSIVSEFNAEDQSLEDRCSPKPSEDDESKTSLTWKLIISHHGHGDDR